MDGEAKPAQLADIDAPTPHRAWIMVFVLSCLYAFSLIDRQIITFMVEPMRRDLHLTDTQIGVLIGPAFAFFFVLFGLPMGYLADRISRKHLIAIGVGAWSLMTAG